MPVEKHVYLDHGMRGWIANTARKQQWRLPLWYAVEDLEQDGFVCYAKCWARYHNLFDVPNPTSSQRRHFMVLVQTSYFRHIATLSAKFARGKDLPIPGDGSVAVLDALLGPGPEVASLVCMLAKLPAELSDVMERLLQDGFDGGQYLRKKVAGSRRKVRETTIEYWERVLGQPNVPERLRDYLVG